MQRGELEGLSSGVCVCGGGGGGGGGGCGCVCEYVCVCMFVCDHVHEHVCVGGGRDGWFRYEAVRYEGYTMYAGTSINTYTALLTYKLAV